MENLNTPVSETPQQSRVKSTQWTLSELKQFFAKARRVYYSPFLDIKLAPQIHSEGHLLLVASRKSGNAPQRNQFKRRVKAIFYEHDLKLCGRDVAVFAKPGIAKLPFAELEAIMVSVCSKKS